MVLCVGKEYKLITENTQIRVTSSVRGWTLGCNFIDFSSRLYGTKIITNETRLRFYKIMVISTLVLLKLKRGFSKENSTAAESESIIDADKGNEIKVSDKRR